MQKFFCLFYASHKPKQWTSWTALPLNPSPPKYHIWSSSANKLNYKWPLATWLTPGTSTYSFFSLMSLEMYVMSSTLCHLFGFFLEQEEPIADYLVSKLPVLLSFPHLGRRFRLTKIQIKIILNKKMQKEKQKKKTKKKKRTKKFALRDHISNDK